MASGVATRLVSGNQALRACTTGIMGLAPTLVVVVPPADVVYTCKQTKCCSPLSIDATLTAPKRAIPCPALHARIYSTGACLLSTAKADKGVQLGPHIVEAGQALPGKSQLRIWPTKPLSILPKDTLSAQRKSAHAVSCSWHTSWCVFLRNKACSWPYGERRRSLASAGLFCKTISTCTPYWDGLHLEVRTQAVAGRVQPILRAQACASHPSSCIQQLT